MTEVKTDFADRTLQPTLSPFTIRPPWRWPGRLFCARYFGSSSPRALPPPCSQLAGLSPKEAWWRMLFCFSSASWGAVSSVQLFSLCPQPGETSSVANSSVLVGDAQRQPLPQPCLSLNLPAPKHIPAWRPRSPVLPKPSSSPASVCDVPSSCRVTRGPGPAGSEAVLLRVIAPFKPPLWNPLPCHPKHELPAVTRRAPGTQSPRLSLPRWRDASSRLELMMAAFSAALPASQAISCDSLVLSLAWDEQPARL